MILENFFRKRFFKALFLAIQQSNSYFAGNE